MSKVFVLPTHKKWAKRKKMKEEKDEDRDRRKLRGSRWVEKKKNVQISVKLSESNERITKEEVGERCRIIVCDVNVFLGRKSWCFLKKKRNLCRVFFASGDQNKTNWSTAKLQIQGWGCRLPPSSKTSYCFYFLLSLWLFFFFFFCYELQTSAPGELSSIQPTELLSKPHSWWARQRPLLTGGGFYAKRLRLSQSVGKQSKY